MLFPSQKMSRPLNILKDFLTPRRIPTNYEKLPQDQFGSSVESLQEEGIPSDRRPQRTSSRPYCCYKRLRVLALCLLVVVAGAVVYMLVAVPRAQPTKPITSLQSTNSVSHSALKIHFKGDSNKQVECDTPLEMVSDEAEAQLVIWPSANAHVDISEYNGEKLRREKPDQLHGFWSLENAEYYPQVATARQKLAAEDPMAFDFEVTYRTTSDFPIPYAYSFFNFTKAALPFETRRQDKLAAAFISNCRPQNNRTDILKKLIELLPGQIDSFGDCLMNADSNQVIQQLDLNPVIPGQPNHTLSRWEEKMRIISRYKFTIAFENANEEDYVTEKYYQALSVGSIPIHLGLTTDQFQKFKPSPNAALNVADFKTVEELADRIKQISKDRDTFNAMLEWKNLPFAARFAEITAWGKVHEACRMAKFFRQEWRNPHALKQERYKSFFQRLNLPTP